MTEKTVAPTTLTPAPVSHAEIDRLLSGAHHDPHSILGAHPAAGVVTVRTLRPHATTVEVEVGSQRYPMTHVHEGVWAAALPGDTVPDYRIRVAYDGDPIVVDDPYRHLPTVGEVDLHLIGEGRHENLWQVLGSRVHTFPSLAGHVTGTSFAVWAPAARGVRVVGDFNHWDGRAHPMRALGSSGVWELFIPGIGDGTIYKYEILGA
ncbi:MAG: 1,4-alpha-glucan branching enzyme, partial [Frankiales bacterium]|nr:1,4-alpha-glucan branching enzyme [Frankiales bacterium]